MKKIKGKYLNINENILNKEKNIILITNILKSIVLIFLLLTWDLIPVKIFALLGINYSNFSQLTILFYLLIWDLSFIVFLIFIYKKDFINDFKKFFNKKLLSNIGLSLAYWIIGTSVMVLSNIIITSINPGSTPANENAVRSLIDIAPWFMVFELVIYAPITEELIFRKSFRYITNNKYIYILLSGIIFGGMHIVSSAPIDLLFLIPYSALGIAFAALYYKTNNIFSTISIHSIHNTLTLVLYLIGSTVS